MNIRRPHPNLIVRSAAMVNFTADQWGLKTDEFPRVVIEKIATYLNSRIRMSFNQGHPADVAKEAVYGLFKDFELYGAGCPKSKELLNKILRNLYSDNIKVGR